MPKQQTINALWAGQPTQTRRHTHIHIHWCYTPNTVNTIVKLISKFLVWWGKNSSNNKKNKMMKNTTEKGGAEVEAYLVEDRHQQRHSWRSTSTAYRYCKGGVVVAEGFVIAFRINFENFLFLDSWKEEQEIFHRKIFKRNRWPSTGIVWIEYLPQDIYGQNMFHRTF